MSLRGRRVREQTLLFLLNPRRRGEGEAERACLRPRRVPLPSPPCSVGSVTWAGRRGVASGRGPAGGSQLGVDVHISSACGRLRLQSHVCWAPAVRRKPREVPPAGGGGEGAGAAGGAPRGALAGAFLGGPGHVTRLKFHFWVWAPTAVHFPAGFPAPVCRADLLPVEGPEPGVTVAVSCSPRPVPAPLPGEGELRLSGGDAAPFGGPRGPSTLPDQLREAWGLWAPRLGLGSTAGGALPGTPWPTLNPDQERGSKVTGWREWSGKAGCSAWASWVRSAVGSGP